MKFYVEKSGWLKKIFMLSPVYKYKMTLAYDGNHYSGWQIQSNDVSIQEILQQKLQILTGKPTPITGAGRTDAQVHAMGQVAHFTTDKLLDPYQFCYSFNCLLPKDIRINHMIEVPLTFHARYSATGKIYHYHLHIGPVESPFTRLHSWHLYQKIDLQLLRQAALLFVGTHDFSSFTNEAYRGAAARNPVRTIHRLDVVNEPGGVRLEFQGDGFLYKMIRNIVGTLVDVATGKRPISDIPKMMEAKDRQHAGKGAPAHGLFLMEVLY
jgi:tRNA pseudouridine38-40 synthase